LFERCLVVICVGDCMVHVGGGRPEQWRCLYQYQHWQGIELHSMGYVLFWSMLCGRWWIKIALHIPGKDDFLPCPFVRCGSIDLAVDIFALELSMQWKSAGLPSELVE